MKKRLTFLLPFLAAATAFGQGEAPGTIKATTKLRPDGSMTTTIVNPDTRTAEETLKDAAGKTLKKTVFTLDERNFSTGATFFDAKGNVRYKETYKRDYADRVVESSLFSAAGKPLGKRVFSYDSRGNAQVQDFDAGGNLIAPAAPASRSGKTQVRKAIPVK